MPGGQPIYITTTTPTLSQPQLPQQQITLAPISSTQQFGNNGTTGATVASPGMFQTIFYIGFSKYAYFKLK